MSLLSTLSITRTEGYAKLRSTTSELTFALVGVCVRIARRLPGLASEQTPEVGAHLVLAPLLYCVALGTLLDENLLSLGNVSHSWLEKHSEGKQDKQKVLK